MQIFSGTHLVHFPCFQVHNKYTILRFSRPHRFIRLCLIPHRRWGQKSLMLFSLLKNRRQRLAAFPFSDPKYTFSHGKGAKKFTTLISKERFDDERRRTIAEKNRRNRKRKSFFSTYSTSCKKWGCPA